MLNSKLYDYTETMNVYELNRFGKFIQSPFYNEDDKLKRFVTAILPIAKTKTIHEAEAKKIWKAVFGAAKYNHAKFIRLMSDTVKKLEQFLVADKFRQQEVLQQSYLLEIMNQRKLSKHFTEAFSLAQKKQTKQTTRDAQFYYHELVLQQQRNYFLENKDQRSAEKNLEDVITGIDTFYFTQKLKYTAAQLHYKNFLSIETELPLVNEVLKHLEKQEQQIPAIEIYYRIILSLTQPNDEAHYKKLTTLIARHSALFSLEEAKSMYVFAMNYCISKINFGKQEYLKELLALYKEALAKDILLEEGFLSQWDYKNIVTVALRINDMKWVFGFIEDYQHKLSKADRQNAYTFNLARYYFYAKKYDNVLQLLQQVEYNDIFYQLDSKTTLLKTYYELGEELPMQSLKDSFRILLGRKKLITPQQRDNYMNLLKLTIKLFNCDVKNKIAMRQLRKEITTTENVADKSWLMEKLKEVSGSL